MGIQTRISCGHLRFCLRKSQEPELGKKRKASSQREKSQTRKQKPHLFLSLKSKNLNEYTSEKSQLSTPHCSSVIKIRGPLHPTLPCLNLGSASQKPCSFLSPPPSLSLFNLQAHASFSYLVLVFLKRLPFLLVRAKQFLWTKGPETPFRLHPSPCPPQGLRLQDDLCKCVTRLLCDPSWRSPSSQTFLLATFPSPSSSAGTFG